jgi:hypothetical protein
MAARCAAPYHRRVMNPIVLELALALLTALSFLLLDRYVTGCETI